MWIHRKYGSRLASIAAAEYFLIPDDAPYLTGNLARSEVPTNSPAWHRTRAQEHPSKEHTCVQKAPRNEGTDRERGGERGIGRERKTGKETGRTKLPENGGERAVS